MLKTAFVTDAYSAIVPVTNLLQCTTRNHGNRKPLLSFELKELDID